MVEISMWFYKNLAKFLIASVIIVGVNIVNLKQQVLINTYIRPSASYICLAKVFREIQCWDGKFDTKISPWDVIT